MPSFFSSGFSRRTTEITTPKEASVEKESPTPTKEEATTAAEEADPWILLGDRNGHQFLWNKKTGQWTYDCIAVYAPLAPAIDAMDYSYYGLHHHHHHQQQQQQQQFFPYVQPNFGYYAPSPYAVVNPNPWQSPPVMATAVPRMFPAAPGFAPIFF